MYLYIYLFIIIILFYLLNNFLNKSENFCYGNTYCNGNKDNALCIRQKCYECGLNAPCNNNKNDNECGANNCIDGCCDGN